jgi:GNAT superfamily N-acetyltransferase
MLIPLPQKHYRKMSPLFEGPHLRLHIDALIEGNAPGQIWVDNLENPRSAYVWDKAHCHYLVGVSDNKNFNEILRKFLNNEIIPNAKRTSHSIFKLYYTAGWEAAIGYVCGTLPMKRGCRFYRFNKSSVQKKESPSNFSLAIIDKNLLQSKMLRNLDLVREEISSCWNSLDDFLEKGFGFLMRNHDEIVGWCTGEYVSDKVCGIGIEVLKKHQGKGLATVMASSFVEYCLHQGITPHWDSFVDNVPSLRVAEKIGFERVSEYSVFFGSFE